MFKFQHFLFEFSETPFKTRNISLKLLKLPKYHFKSNLFFLQLKYLKCAIKFGKKIDKKASPPLLSKSPHFELWTFLSLELTFSSFWDIFYFHWSPKGLFKAYTILFQITSLLPLVIFCKFLMTSPPLPN